MSCYKALAPDFLRESLKSVYDDPFFEKEVFIYCDGLLTESHYKIINCFKGKGLNAYYANENKGLATAMNFLIDIVVKMNFKYIARMDADDIVINNRFERQYKFLENNPSVDILGGWCIEIDDDGNEVFKKKLPTNHDDLKKKMIGRSCVIHPTIMVKSSVFESGLRFNEKLFNMQDYELWSRLFSCNYKFANLNEFILKFRFDDNFISRRKGLDRFKVEILLRYQHLKRNSLLNLSNILLICFSSSSRLLPNFLLKFLYKKAR